MVPHLALTTGVFLYLLDVVLRTIQQNFNSTVVTASPDCTSAASRATRSPDSGMLTLSLRCHGGMSWVGSDTVFLNVPAVSWWRWHPFTVASSSEVVGPNGEKRMVLHIKKYDRWTQRLISRLSDDTAPVRIYVSGPYANANRKWIAGADRHVFIAGGIGVTPALGMLQELISHRKKAQAAAAASGSSLDEGSGATLVWVSRNRGEFTALPDEVLEASRGKGSWLDVQLYFTGNSSSPSKAGASGEATAAADKPTTDDDTEAKAAISLTVSAAGAVSPPALADNRPLSHPYMFHPLLWAVAVVLCFGGGFLGLICSQAYDAHIARTVAVRKDFSLMGMLQFSALGVVHLWRLLSLRRKALSAQPSFNGGDTEMPNPAADTAAPTAMSGYSTISESSGSANGAEPAKAVKADIDYAHAIKDGRPNWAELLGAVATCSSDGAQLPVSGNDAAQVQAQVVGVFVAGPERLVTAVDEACAALNGVWGRAGRAYLAVTALTHEL
ncbi:hypothetical protein GPECTOR_42g831 [Gonium pectorale]|uniref:FAD-binding FR-type domain-containing protein n=1 Tax=Gonium pectorale TaxID=33097 RepID=A0A150GB83_GONPE|nr:hypothetical protein GPECTOR_42g831 [Gonium pectorale]|eukprot:KXZ46620.1 hypothetical protein GPECTOR_42g831 [Gonium pectorale]